MTFNRYTYCMYTFLYHDIYCRHLLAKCWTSRKADEWEESIKHAAVTTGKEFTQEPIRHGSYAPVRENSYARW